jgi:hypothetical protein
MVALMANKALAHFRKICVFYRLNRHTFEIASVSQGHLDHLQRVIATVSHIMRRVIRANTAAAIASRR